MIRVRAAGVGDVATIARIHVEAWQASYPGIVPDAYLVGLSARKQEDQWRRTIRRADHLDRVYVSVDAREGGETVTGFASCGPARHEKGSRRSANDGEIYTLYVEPDLRGAGYGRALLRHCLDDLYGEGRRHAIVWVLAANPSRFFYEAQGATLAGRRDERFAGTTLEMYGYVWPLPVDEADQR